MSFDASDWLRHFVLPLVAGGDVRVAHAIGTAELAFFGEGLDAEAKRALAEARHAVVSEIQLDAPPPPLDEESLRIAAAMQNLLFLLHPGTHAPSVTRRRLRTLSAYTTDLATLPLPDSGDERAIVARLAARHSLLHHLFDLGRDDVRVSFWVGSREFRGAEPPSRLLKWPNVRRVREERWRVTVAAEAMADPLVKPIMTALVASSPLTDLFEPVRLEPALDLASLARWLRLPEVARAVADRWLTLGKKDVASHYTAALLSLYNDKAERARPASRTATAFLCHLQLLELLGKKRARVELAAEVQAQPALRDYYGLFAAARRAGLQRPDDVAADPRLRALVDGYAAACAEVAGKERLAELIGLCARGVGYLEVT